MAFPLAIEGRGHFLDLLIAERRIDAEIRAEIAETAREYRDKARAMILTAKSGRLYGPERGRIVYRKKKGKLVKRARNVRAYQASAPGQPPARFTGTLAFVTRAKVARGNKYGATVFAHRKMAFYRHMLEFGTKHILPRPLWSPLQRALTDDLYQRISRRLDAVTRATS